MECCATNSSPNCFPLQKKQKKTAESKAKAKIRASASDSDSQPGSEDEKKTGSTSSSSDSADNGVSRKVDVALGKKALALLPVIFAA